METNVDSRATGQQDGETAALPNFLILGSAKCATTSIHYYLNQHPEIFMTGKKECHFFCAPEIDDRHYQPQYQPIRKRGEYESLFKDVGASRVLGESSPMYLFYPQAAERIREAIPNAKLLAILRNPADRAFSAYLHAVRDGLESLPFEEALEAEPERMRSGQYSATHAYGEFGFYFEKLRPYYDRFSRDQIKVLLYEQVNGNMQESLRDLCEFLNVSADFSFDTRPRLNVSGVPKKRWIQRFAEELGKDSWWVNIVKKPFTNSAWVRTVKTLQYSNYKKPTLSAEARTRVLERYREDMDKLSRLISQDVLSVWTSSPESSRRS